MISANTLALCIGAENVELKLVVFIKIWLQKLKAATTMKTGVYGKLINCIFNVEYKMQSEVKNKAKQVGNKITQELGFSSIYMVRQKSGLLKFFAVSSATILLHRPISSHKT